MSLLRYEIIHITYCISPAAPNSTIAPCLPLSHVFPLRLMTLCHTRRVCLFKDAWGDEARLSPLPPPPPLSHFKLFLCWWQKPSLPEASATSESDNQRPTRLASGRRSVTNDDQPADGVINDIAEDPRLINAQERGSRRHNGALNNVEKVDELADNVWTSAPVQRTVSIYARRPNQKVFYDVENKPHWGKCQWRR